MENFRVLLPLDICCWPKALFFVQFLYQQHWTVSEFDLLSRGEGALLQKKGVCLSYNATKKEKKEEVNVNKVIVSSLLSTESYSGILH